jgi:hypothetical protein
MLPTASPDVVFAPLEGGAVLFDKSAGTYYGLNVVGARVWEMLSPDFGSVDAICGALQVQYRDVDPGELRNDVRELLDELAAFGLVVEPSSLALTQAEDA